MALALLLTTSAAQAQTAVAPSTGIGTLADPYQITELGNLVWMGDNVATEGVSGKYYKLMNDIDASPTADWNDPSTDGSVLEGFKPIGTKGSGDPTDFRGSFDGNGRKITGLTIHRPTTEWVALFGYVGLGGEVKNLALDGGTVVGWYYVGGLVGANSGTITNCHATGGAWSSPGGNDVGGLVGTNSGTITNCYATGVASSANGGYVGGLAGNNNGGTITSCTATTDVSGLWYVGGLTGYNNGGTIAHCCASGTVSGGNGNLVSGAVYFVGGLVANNTGGTVTNSYATGAVSGVLSSSYSSAGGLAGSNDGMIRYCYSTGAVTNGAGLVGNRFGTIWDSYWDTQTSGCPGFPVDGARATAQMKQQATFAAWNFTNTWSIEENVSYPYLSGIPSPPIAPLNVLPIDGAVDVMLAPTLSASAFCDPNPTDTHVASQWQVRRASSPGDWSTTVFDSGTTAALTSCSVPPGVLVWLTNYSWRVRYEDNHGAWGNWSGGTFFSANHAPHTPVNLAPAAVATNVSLPVTLTASPFSSPEAGTTHAASQWQVRAASSPADWSLPAFDSGTMPTALTGCAVPTGALVGLADYRWRVRYRDNLGCWSLWSSETTFSTVWAIPQAVKPDGSGYRYDPYLIVELGNLVWLSGHVQSEGTVGGDYAELMKDIDASDSANWNGGFTPIGNAARPYEAVFNGNGRKISRLVISRPTADNSGLFGLIYPGGGISSLTLEGGSVSGLVSVGGLAGCVSGGTISNCGATCAVTGVGYVGGLVGASLGITIEDCYATGRVAGSDYVGGLVGMNNNSLITSCYATGGVSGGSYVGGLAGDNETGTISGCYSTGNVSGGSYVAGLVGYGTSSSSYWDTQTSGQPSPPFGGTGEGKTTAQMKQQATFVGWDFVTVWGISPAINSGYPYLQCSAVPQRATSPTPGDGATGVPISADLSWADGGGATTYNVYFGITNPPPGPVSSDQTGASYDPGALATGTTYYWRIDAKNSLGIATGDVWSFTTETAPPASKATSPSPSNGATRQSIGTSLAWSDGGGATSYDVYFGNSNPPPTLVSSGQAGTSYAPGTLANSKTYYWRIDARNSAGTTTGDVWSFTTVWSSVIVINSITELQRIGNDPGYPLDGSYVLGRDIDASGTATWNDGGTTTALVGFRPIGNNSAPFTGLLDGAGYTITGLVINRPTTNHVGVFGIIGSGGTLENLRLDGGAVTGSDGVGGLAWFNEGAISNCYTTGAVTASGDNVGGLVAQNFGGTITNCYATGTVAGGHTVGGLAGQNNGGTITDCHAAGAVTASRDYAGGLAGQNYNGTLTNCYATGSVTSTGRAGGLTGQNNGGAITNCHATGAIADSGDYAGGLAGQNYGGPITNCFATGTVNGFAAVGGLAGNNDNAITNCYATGAVTAGGYAGGLVGQHYGGTITNCYATGTVVGLTGVGGLVGAVVGSSTTSSYWDTQSSGQGVSAGGVGKTTAEMKQQATFLGWDFTNVWAIVENSTYPFFILPPAPPSKATNPSPSNGATRRSINTGLSWSNDGGATSYDVYFGTSNPPTSQVANGQAATTYTLPTLAYSTTYYWRVDAKNSFGTTTGDTWSFTMAPLVPVGAAFWVVR